MSCLILQNIHSLQHVTFLLTKLVCKYLQHHKLEHKEKHKKGCCQHYWEIIFHYAKIYCVCAIWEEEFGKLLCLFSYLTCLFPKSSLHFEAVTIFNVDTGTTHRLLSTVIFCFENLGWKMWCRVSLGFEWYWSAKQIFRVSSVAQVL